MEKTGSNQPIRYCLWSIGLFIVITIVITLYKIIQKSLQKRRMSYGMVTPTDLHRVTKPCPTRSLPEELQPEPLEPLPGTPEPPPVPAASPIMEDVASGSASPDILDSDSWTTISTSEDAFITHDVSPASSPESSEESYLGDYRLLRTLGEGYFGEVKLAVHRVTGELVAIKIIEKPEDPEELSRIYREVTIMQKLDHPNIVKLFEVMDLESSIVLVMEYCSGGDLAHFISSGYFRGEEFAKFFFRQIVSAVQYCHENNVTHRDLKLDNILIDKDYNIKITDFGLSSTFSQGESLWSCCGTPQYAAPEILAAESYEGTQVDIWSLGVVLYSLVTNELPFKGDTMEEIYEAIMSSKYKPPDTSKQCRKLIKQMLQVDQTKRATMENIIQSRWLREETARVQWWKAARNFFRQCCSCFSDPETCE